MVGDALQHLAQICLRVEAVQFGGADQTIHCSGPLAAGIGSDRKRSGVLRLGRVLRELVRENEVLTVSAIADIS